MDTKTLKKLIDGDSKRCAEIATQKKYIEGKNVAILGRAAHEEPDNRISIPIVRKAVAMVSGYMAGAGAITYSTEIDEKYYEETLKPIFDANDEGLTTHEEFETACAHGSAWEYHYMLDGEPRFVEVPVEQCIPVWDDSLPRKLIMLVRYYTKEDEAGKEYKEVYTYDKQNITKYAYKMGGEVVLVTGEPNPIPHAYGEVPFAEAKISRYGTNIFDHVRSIIDFRDRIVSEDYANEAQRFASSYLLLRNRLSTELDDTGMNEIDKLKITRTFEDLGDNVNNAVAFLVKNIPIDFIKNADELFERLAYDMMLLFDNKDLATTGQISGISLAYKLLPFEYACATYEAYFSRFLQWRIRLIQNATGNLKVNPQDRPQVSIKFNRNLPFDLQAAVEMFMKVSPVQLPVRVALRLLPDSLVPDVEETAKEIEEGTGTGSVEGAEEGGAEIVAGEDVQAQALNGAQVASLVTVAQAVADNQLPLATAVEIVLAAMPTMTREDAMRMLQPADAFTPDKPEVVAPIGKPAPDANKGE
ncbi:MAG: phage portal protein [Candidatus Omnitrophota bacterium]